MWLFDKAREFVKGLKNYDIVPSKARPKYRPAPKPRADVELPGCDRQWMGIVWHHSETPDSMKIDWDGIRRYHTSYRIDGYIVDRERFYSDKKAGRGRKFVMPWSDIGYHGGIENVHGTVRWRLGRSWDKSGAHAGLPGNARFNRHYLGLCAVGNFNQAKPERDRWELALAITRLVMDRFDMKTEDVIGHRETYALAGVAQRKTCPGALWDMDEFRGSL